MDAAFLERIADHADALNSAAHSFKGDYGADDIAAVLRNSVSMLLARRGVTQDMLPDLMKNAVDKFGPLANQFATLNGAIQRGLGGMRGLEFLKEGMTQFRSLEGHARALISLMSREQKVDMGIATPGDVDPQSEEIQRQDGELLSEFLESKFEVFGDTEQIPVMRGSSPARTALTSPGSALRSTAPCPAPTGKPSTSSWTSSSPSRDTSSRPTQTPSGPFSIRSTKMARSRA